MSVPEISDKELLPMAARKPAQEVRDFSPLRVPAVAEMKTQVWEGE